MARESTKMSAEEISSFLERMEWVAVGSCNEQKQIDAEAAACLFRGTDLVFSIPSTSRTAKNIERSSKIVCSNDVFPTYYEIKGVSVHGTPKKMSETGVTSEERNELLKRTESLGLASADVVYTLSLEDAFGFDFAKIKAKLA